MTIQGQPLRDLGLLLIWMIGTSPQYVLGQSSIGIQPLLETSKSSVETLIPSSTRLLITGQDQVIFLTEIEKSPPTWETLHDQPGEERGTRLFAFNRARDDARANHPALKQHIAFFWSGILRQFDSEHQGFRVAMGPVRTKTPWGTVRFKPVNLPSEMIAVPGKRLVQPLSEKITRGEKIEIHILFTGFLAPNESLMYAFSHENSDQGMILPFVRIDGVQYILP